MVLSDIEKKADGTISHIHLSSCRRVFRHHDFYVDFEAYIITERCINNTISVIDRRQTRDVHAVFH